MLQNHAKSVKRFLTVISWCFIHHSEWRINFYADLIFLFFDITISSILEKQFGTQWPRVMHSWKESNVELELCGVKCIRRSKNTKIRDKTNKKKTENCCNFSNYFQQIFLLHNHLVCWAKVESQIWLRN